jgi:hypothetical protein
MASKCHHLQLILLLLFSKPNIDRSQQEVSASIIQIQLLETFPQETEGPETKPGRVLISWLARQTNLEPKLFSAP